MTLKQLEYFLKIVQYGSISKAAPKLFISQPSLTKSISSLEEEYGIQLLIRKANGVELTTEGKSFYHYAHSVLTAVHALESNFSNKSSTGRSRLFIAAQQLDFIYDLILKTYYLNEDQDIHFNLVESDRNAVTRLVLDGKVNLGLLVRNVGDSKTHLWHTEAKRLNQYAIARAGVYVSVGPKSPYYDRRSLTFPEAENSVNVVLDMEDTAKQDMYFDTTSNHYNMKKLVFFNTISACEQFLLQSDALMYTAKWAIGCFRDPHIRTIPIIETSSDSPSLQNELFWIKRVGEPLTPTEMQFIQHLYRHFGLSEPQL